jgi:hypothetical protein
MRNNMLRGVSLFYHWTCFSKKGKACRNTSSHPRGTYFAKHAQSTGAIHRTMIDFYGVFIGKMISLVGCLRAFCHSCEPGVVLNCLRNNYLWGARMVQTQNIDIFHVQMYLPESMLGTFNLFTRVYYPLLHILHVQQVFNNFIYYYYIFFYLTIFNK